MNQQDGLLACKRGVPRGGLAVVCKAVVTERACVSRAELPLLFPSCTRASLVKPVQTTELGTTPESPICQSLFMRSRTDSQGLVLRQEPYFPA